METYKLKRKSLGDQVIERIEEQISKGEYKPGDKLPVENDLAVYFGVSRITIREAIKKLSMMGIVDIRQGDGTFIKKISPESFMKPLLGMILLDKKDIYDISVARLTIEVKTIELAVMHASAADITHLENLLEKMEKNLKDGNYETYNSNDLLYHLYIAKCSKNTILYRMLEVIQDLIRCEIKTVSTVPLANERSILRHRMILDSIIGKNKDAAVQAMREHIDDAVEYLKKEML